MTSMIVEFLGKLSEGLNMFIIIVLITALGALLIGPLFSTDG